MDDADVDWEEFFVVVRDLLSVAVPDVVLLMIMEMDVDCDIVWECDTLTVELWVVVTDLLRDVLVVTLVLWLCEFERVNDDECVGSSDNDALRDSVTVQLRDAVGDVEMLALHE